MANTNTTSTASPYHSLRAIADTTWRTVSDDSRRVARDDTANDLHELAPHATIDNAQSSATARSGEQAFEDAFARSWGRIQRQSRRPLSRIMNDSNASCGDESVTGSSKTQSLGRRFSSRAKESVDRLSQSIRLPTVSVSRARRSSTPHRLEDPAGAQGMCPDSTTLSHAPTSPSKRCARQADGPRKQRWMALSDRKDTPAPAGSSLPVRPAINKSMPMFISAPGGGEDARKAAAAAALAHNPAIFTSLGAWEEEQQQLQLQHRRNRLGSLSSAADSGADLSTYSGSDHASLQDEDGDITMSAVDEPSSLAPSRNFDLARSLPAEIALQIFEYLDAKELSLVERVNSKWYALARDTSVWRTVFLRKYQRPILTDPPPIQVGGQGVGRPNRPNQEWRRMYKARVALEKNWRAGAQDAGKAVYLSGHTDSVYCLQFDEEKIITGSRDRTIRVWDINTFQCTRVIGAPQYKPILGPKVLRTVDYPSFHMATASVNGTAYGDSIYHVPSEWHDASILCLQYDDQVLVTGSSDSDLLIWDIKTYEPIRRLKKHTGGVLDVALDSKHIVSCSKDSRIIVWDRATFEPIGELTGHRGPVNAVQLRGHLLVSASGDGIARLWDLNQMKLVKEFSAKERGLAAVEFSEDMKYVLAGGNDNITYKFETETGLEVKQFTGHTQLVRSLWLDSANNRVVSGSYDLDLRVYDFESGQELWRGAEWTTSWMLAAKSDYRRIVATSQDGRILIVDFGIMKGAPHYHSRDGSSIEDIDLLRGTDHTTAISWRNPFNGRLIQGFA